MNEPHIVTPQQGLIDNSLCYMYEPEVAHTVATEPDRTRAAVVKALRNFRDRFDSFDSDYDNAIVMAIADEAADAIENGADW